MREIQFFFLTKSQYKFVSDSAQIISESFMVKVTLLLLTGKVIGITLAEIDLKRAGMVVL